MAEEILSLRNINIFDGRTSPNYAPLMDKYKISCVASFGVCAQGKEGYPLKVPEKSYSYFKLDDPVAEKEKEILLELSGLSAVKFDTAYNAIVNLVIPEQEARVKAGEVEGEFAGAMIHLAANLALYNNGFELYPCNFEGHYLEACKKVSGKIAVLQNEERERVFEKFGLNPVSSLALNFIDDSREKEKDAPRVCDLLMEEVMSYLKRKIES